jgi:hypothetical protein
MREDAFRIDWHRESSVRLSYFLEVALDPTFHVSIIPRRKEHMHIIIPEQEPEPPNETPDLPDFPVLPLHFLLRTFPYFLM